ncbi:hypothetical protein F8568_015830 [Actinomadura sp. LD22]|uniref:Transposase n=1 Tax=Actinomadura physcomitrii TaxID=2650748 RepID=A0A6I4MC31_9ACTN|nr:hypothetical protein [Actinomadura physcomitrii]MWA01814.1 hypothetical protein [Actinomadura physcomitrii]
MKIVVRVKLLPTPEQAAALMETLRACNAASRKVSRVAFERKVFPEVACRNSCTSK